MRVSVVISYYLEWSGQWRILFSFITALFIFLYHLISAPAHLIDKSVIIIFTCGILACHCYITLVQSWNAEILVHYCLYVTNLLKLLMKGIFLCRVKTPTFCVKGLRFKMMSDLGAGFFVCDPAFPLTSQNFMVTWDSGLSSSSLNSL